MCALRRLARPVASAPPTGLPSAVLTRAHTVHILYIQKGRVV